MAKLANENEKIVLQENLSAVCQADTEVLLDEESED